MRAGRLEGGGGDSSRWWSIVLAGGNGERLGAWVRESFGHERPKQYCTFVGSRSMLEHTLDRAYRVTAPDRKVTVVAMAHREESGRQLRSRRGVVIEQPANRNTAAGLFLPLSYVRAHATDATIVVYPSDHFIHPEEPFVETVRAALRAAERLRDRVVLIGFAPDGAEQDYGWVSPGEEIAWLGDFAVREVSRFVEKPGFEAAEAALGAGALWNTMVFAARGEALWELGRRVFPEVVELLEPVGSTIGTSEEDAVLERVYRTMPCADFSRHLLEKAPERIAVVELRGTHWSDWGRPERIARSLALVGKKPKVGAAREAGSRSMRKLSGAGTFASRAIE